MTEEVEEKEKKGLFKKFTEKLSSTRKSLFGKATGLFRRGRKVDEELLEELEEILITSDVGIETTMHLVDSIREAAKKVRGEDLDELWLREVLKEIMLELLGEEPIELKTADGGPSVYLVVGVNGVGKTTTIGKLASRLSSEGKSVQLVAADTFRAAAIEQLEIWSERAGVPLIKGQEGSDPASVVFDGLQSAISKGTDALIIDTAGRLQTKTNLMQELGKVFKVIQREIPEAPHETLLVVDASTGQNGLTQAKVFTEAAQVSALVLTKLDGTAKGGVTLAVHRELGLPVKYVGLGEQIDDLEPFNKKAFVEAMLPEMNEEVLDMESSC